MAQLFNVKVPAVSKHIKDIYEEGELQRNPTISILETVRMEGNRKVSRNVEYYNLDVIIFKEEAQRRRITKSYFCGNYKY